MNARRERNTMGYDDIKRNLNWTSYAKNLSEVSENYGGIERFLAKQCDDKVASNWKEILRSGDSQVFHRRCALEKVFSRYENRSKKPTPQRSKEHWVSFLEELFCTPRFSRPTLENSSQEFKGLPFLETVSTLSDKAATILFRKLTVEERSLLSPGAIRDFLLSLDRVVILILGGVLQLETTRGVRGAGFLGRSRRLKRANEIAESFDGDVLPDLLTRHPVLARILSERLMTSINSMHMCIRSLAQDAESISREFGCSYPLEVLSVTTDLSDPHHNGLTVTKITFTSKRSVFFKPRSLALDIQFSHLCTWINERLGSRELLTPRVLSTATHGWTECIDHQTINDETALRKFYYRSGLLLGVLHLVDGTDCHSENIIAFGEYPVLIDVETLFHAFVEYGRTPNESDARLTELNEFMKESVLRLGYLPRWRVEPGRESVSDSSALGATGRRTLTCHLLDPGSTAAHERTYETSTPLSSPLGDQKFLPSFAPEEVRKGFSALMDLLLKYRHELLSPASPLEGFRTLSSRAVIRPTEEYALVLSRSLHVDCLTDGVKRSLIIELLARKALSENVSDDWFNVFLAERDAIERCDIPHFSVPIDGTSLQVESRDLLKSVISESAWSRMRRRLESIWDIELLKMNERLIHESLSMRTEPESALDAISRTPMTRTSRISLGDVKDIADILTQASISLPDGSLTWSTPQVAHPKVSGRYNHSLVGTNLYEGLGGIALLFSGLYKITGRRRYREVAQKILMPIVENSHEMMNRKEQLGVGLSRGRASLIYSLYANARLLQERRLLDIADSFVDCTTTEKDNKDSIYDLLGGSAGELLALLRLYDESGKTEALNEAKKLGDYLIDAGFTREDGSLVWHGISKIPLAGMAHGAAGIGYALGELFRVSGETIYCNASLSAFRYEGTIYSNEKKGWPDFRDDVALSGDQVFPCAWCHGGAGIGLSRLGVYTHMGNASIEKEIGHAVQQVRLHPDFGRDSLCCGILSRVEFLVKAGCLLGDRTLTREGHRMAERCIARARAMGGYSCLENVPRSVIVPGLFSGLAGIGYELLRLLEPDAIPSIHLFE